MGALPSREHHEDPSKIVFGQVGETRGAYLPLTVHFFPSPDCLAFRQLFDARKHQSAKYYYVPLSDTPALLDDDGKPIDACASAAADAAARARRHEEWVKRERERAELTSVPLPTSSYVLDREPRLVPFLAADDRPAVFDAVQPLQVEGAPMDAVRAAPRQPVVSRYEAVTTIDASNYGRFFPGGREHCVEDETADLATIPRGPDDDEGRTQTNRAQALSHASSSSDSSSSPPSPSVGSHTDGASTRATLQHDVSVAYDRHDRNKEYYYYATPDALYSILVARQVSHVLDTNVEMCALYAQEGEWLAGRQRLRQSRLRARSRARRQAQCGSVASSASLPASASSTHDGLASTLPPPPREFIRPISEALVVFLTIEEEAHALAESLGIFVEEAMTRIVSRTLRASRTQVVRGPPRERHGFESEPAYKDGRLHLVEEDGVLYLFAYKKRTPAPSQCQSPQEADKAGSGGSLGDGGDTGGDSVDAFALPIQPVRVFGANCLIESWCRATPWTRGMDDDPEEDAYIEFEMPVKPPVMRPAWFVDARVGGERLLAQLSCMESVLYGRICCDAGLPGPLMRPGWEKDPLFGLPMLQTSRKLSAYIVTKLREAAASGDLAARALEDIKAVLTTAVRADGQRETPRAQQLKSSEDPQAEKERIDAEVIDALMKLAGVDDSNSQWDSGEIDDGDDDEPTDDASTAAAVEAARQRALTINALRELVHQCDVRQIKIDGVSTTALRRIAEDGALPQRNSRYRSTFSVRGNYGIVRARVESLLFFSKIYDILGLDDTLLDEALATDESQGAEEPSALFPAAPPATDTPPENYSEQLFDYGGAVRLHCLRAPPATRPMQATDEPVLRAIASSTGGKARPDDSFSADHVSNTEKEAVPALAEPSGGTDAHMALFSHEPPPSPSDTHGGAAGAATLASVDGVGGAGAAVGAHLNRLELPRIASFVVPAEEAQVLPPPPNLDDIRDNHSRQERQWRAWKRYLINRTTTCGEAKQTDATSPSETMDSGREASVGHVVPGHASARDNAVVSSEIVPMIVYVAVNTSRLAEGPSNTHAEYVESLVQAMEKAEAAKESEEETAEAEELDALEAHATPPHRYVYPAHYALDSQLLVYNVLVGQWEHLAVALRRNTLRYERVCRQVAAMAAADRHGRRRSTECAGESAAPPPPLPSLVASVAYPRDVGLTEVLVCWIKRVQRQIPLTNRRDPCWLRDAKTGRIVQDGRYYMYTVEKAGEKFYCGVVPHFATDRRKIKKKMLREAAAAAAAVADPASSSEVSTPMLTSATTHRAATAGARSVTSEGPTAASSSSALNAEGSAVMTVSPMPEAGEGAADGARTQSANPARTHTTPTAPIAPENVAYSGGGGRAGHAAVRQDRRATTGAGVPVFSGDSGVGWSCHYSQSTAWGQAASAQALSPPPPPPPYKAGGRQAHLPLHSPMNTGVSPLSPYPVSPYPQPSVYITQPPPTPFTSSPVASAHTRHSPRRGRSHSKKVWLAVSPTHPMEECGLDAYSPMRAESAAAPAMAGAATSASGDAVKSQKPVGKAGRFVWDPYGS